MHIATPTRRIYRGAKLPPMSVGAPVYKPQSAKQCGVQPDKTSAAQNQWFTKTEAAASCIEITKRALARVGKNWDDYMVVEPSAGDGIIGLYYTKHTLQNI